MSQAAEDGKRGVEVIQLEAVLCNLEEELNEFHPVFETGLRTNFSHHPKHLFIHQFRKLVEVRNLVAFVLVEDALDVLRRLDVSEKLEVSEAELRRDILRFHVQQHMTLVSSLLVSIQVQLIHPIGV